MHRISSIIAILLVTLLTACHHGSSGETDSATAAPDQLQNSGQEITITGEQFQNAGMTLGNPEIIHFKKKIQAKGYVMAKPGALVRVSALYPGIVTDIYVSNGQKVQAGGTLFKLSGDEIIQIQQEYAEVNNMLPLLESNYNRQKQLAEGNISSQKELIKAESDYRVQKARAEGLKARLKLIGLDAVAVGSGSISSSISVKSPISGYVSSMNLVKGQYVTSNEALIEIVDPANMQLDLQIFEKDLDLLEPGQEIIFFDPDHPDEKFTATLTGIGRAVDSDNRSIHCIGTIVNSGGKNFVHHYFVEAEIVTSQYDAPALPASAVLSENEEDYIFVLKDRSSDQYVFKKVIVKTGIHQDDYTEITDEGFKDVMLRGGFQLVAE